MHTFFRILFFIVFVSQICFAQWIPVGLEDKSIKDIAVSNSLIFVVNSDSGKLYRSADNGINWSTIFELGVIDIDVSPSGDVFMLKDSIYNTGPKQLFRSTDAGSSWIYLNVVEQLADSNIYGGPDNVKVSPIGRIYCEYERFTGRSEGHNTIAISADNGLSWSPTSITGGDAYDFRGNSVLTIGNSWERGGSASRTICLSEDGGFQWSCWHWGNGSSGSYSSSGAISLCSNGNILAGVTAYGSGIILSEDTCLSWTQVSTLIPNAGVSIETGGWLVGNDSLGVFLFSDSGDSLGSRNDGLTNLNIHTLTIDNNNYVYAGTDDGIWRRPLSDIITSFEVFSIKLHSIYNLEQNYPNPFNPSTTIKYSIPARSNVTLKIFDVLGKEIITLVDKEQHQGNYEIEFDGKDLTSGTYFFQLKASTYAETKKMILLK